jgi:hypothetical protein
MPDQIRRNEMVPVSSRKTWPVGQRVTRKTSDAEGTVADTANPIKVSWDDGATSYYRHSTDADVKAREL